MRKQPKLMIVKSDFNASQRLKWVTSLTSLEEIKSHRMKKVNVS